MSTCRQRQPELAIHRKSRLYNYYAWFAPASAHLATVIFITVAWTNVSLLFFRRWRAVRSQAAFPAMVGLGSIDGHPLVIVHSV